MALLVNSSAVARFLVVLAAAWTAGTGRITSTWAGDWPAARYDARHSGMSPDNLPAQLSLQWQRQLPPCRPAWPEQPKLRFDAWYEPVVAGRLLVVSIPQEDSIAAFDTRSGAEAWRFWADGPVRLPPVIHADQVFAASDDGHLYCLNLSTGQLLWKFRGGPEMRPLLGNERLISTWPARGGPVVADDTVYFAAGIWPFMGIFLHALDTSTGAVRWTNDGEGSRYMKQPHKTDSFAGIAPQGLLTVTGDKLLVSGGRSVPAVHHRDQGRLLHFRLADHGKYGDSAVMATDHYYFNGGAAFDLANGDLLGTAPWQLLAAADESAWFYANKEKLYGSASAAARDVPSLDSKGKLTKARRLVLAKPWFEAELETSCLVLIQAGKRLYAGGANQVAAIELPPPPAPRTQSPGVKKDDQQKDKPGGSTPADAPQSIPVAWQAAIAGTVASLVAADDRLFVVTREGGVSCFGPAANSKTAATAKFVTHRLEVAPLSIAAAEEHLAEQILAATGHRAGWAVVGGAQAGNLAAALVARSELMVVGLQSDNTALAAARQAAVAAQQHGTRLSYLPDQGRFGGLFSGASAASTPGVATPWDLPLYLCELLVVAAGDTAPDRLVTAQFAALMESVRPYGGTACLVVEPDRASAWRQKIESLRLPQLQVTASGPLVMVTRVGPLPGSANWTHEHADAANSRVGRDQLVRLPLGVLWFGGPSHQEVLPRHGHGPQPQIVDGRAIVEGPDHLRAMDIYTGRLLWTRQLPALGKLYNTVLHFPGANATGSNYVSLSDGIYVVHGTSCLRLDPRNGQTLAEFHLPHPRDSGQRLPWTFLTAVDRYLVAGADPPVGEIKDPFALRPSFEQKFGSKQLFVLDRFTGQVLWSLPAEYEFRHNAICLGGGKLFAIDLDPKSSKTLPWVPSLSSKNSTGDDDDDDKDKAASDKKPDEKTSADKKPDGNQAEAKQPGDKKPSDKPQAQPVSSPPNSRLIAVDLATGQLVWTSRESIFGTWLSYSPEHNVLVESGRPGRDTLKDEPLGMRAYQGADGRPLWYQPKYSGPALLHHDQVLCGQMACELKTGRPVVRTDPLTGQTVPWTWTRNYGCNAPQAAEHLMVFRSGAAGFLDLADDGGTGNFGGFRSSCTNNLMVAGGVLCAPDYTRTCTCSYQNQTSLALVHMPEVELWTRFDRPDSSAARAPVRQLALNLGAPGQRRDAEGRLWWDQLSAVEVKFDLPGLYTLHSSRVAGDALPWVAASGCRGIRRLEIDLQTDPKAPPARYTVRLIFCDPDHDQPGQRRFDVRIQNRTVLSEFDIAAAAGGRYRSVVRQFTGIQAGNEIEIDFRPLPPPQSDSQASATSSAADDTRQGLTAPVLCGVEILREGQPPSAATSSTERASPDGGALDIAPRSATRTESSAP